jgi:ATP-dependent RNA helicase DeaD
MLITPVALVPATRLLRSARIPHRFEPIPTAHAIRKATDERLFAELSSASEESSAQETPSAKRATALAQRLLASGQAERVLARLLESRYADLAEPRDVRTLESHPRGDRGRQRDRGGRAPERREPPRDRAPATGPSEGYVPFRVTWGGRHGADPRRLLALACRRGQIRGTDVGAIHVEADHSIIEVASAVARSFATHASKPDPRDRRVRIAPLEQQQQRDGRKPLQRRR